MAAWGEKNPCMAGPSRAFPSAPRFLIDESGRVARIWRGVKVDGHADAVLGCGPYVTMRGTRVSQKLTMRVRGSATPPNRADRGPISEPARSADVLTVTSQYSEYPPAPSALTTARPNAPPSGTGPGAPQAASNQNGYTIAHAGKQVRVGPVAFLELRSATVIHAWAHGRRANREPILRSATMFSRD